jgi:hypothetical protein
MVICLNVGIFRNFVFGVSAKVTATAAFYHLANFHLVAGAQYLSWRVCLFQFIRSTAAQLPGEEKV